MSENNHKNDIPVKEISQLFDLMGQKVPELLAAIKDTLYSEAAGRDLGKAVGAFYQELLASGLKSDEALAMTKEYMGALQEMMRSNLSTWER